MSVIVFRPNRTRYFDSSAEHLDDVRRAAENGHHVYVELNGTHATRDALSHMMRSINETSPATPGIVVLYCKTISGLPRDQNEQSLITPAIKSVLSGWGLCFVGGWIRSGLSHKLLEAGADFVLSFRKGLAYLTDYAHDVFDVINSGLDGLFQGFLNPQGAAATIRRHFFQKSKECASGEMDKELRGLVLLYDGQALECSLPAVRVRSPKPVSAPTNRDLIRIGHCSNANSLLMGRRTAKPPNWLALFLAVLYASIVYGCFAVAVLKDINDGIRLLVSFQGAITVPLSAALAYYYGKSRGQEDNQSNSNDNCPI